MRGRGIALTRNTDLTALATRVTSQYRESARQQAPYWDLCKRPPAPTGRARPFWPRLARIRAPGGVRTRTAGGARTRAPCGILPPAGHSAPQRGQRGIGMALAEPRN